MTKLLDRFFFIDEEDIQEHKAERFWLYLCFYIAVAVVITALLTIKS